MAAEFGVAGDEPLDRPRLCVVVTTPLVLHFFLRPHLSALAGEFDVTVVYNPRHDPNLPPLGLAVRQAEVSIERRIAPLADLIALWQLWRLFRREQFDAVVSVVPKAGLLGMVAAWLAGVPRRVHIFQGEVWASKRGAVRRLLKAMDRVIVTLATHVLAVSPSERSFLEAEGVALGGRVGVLGSGSIKGVNLHRFRPDPASRSEVRRHLAIPEDAVVGAFLGRVTRDKGVIELAGAFRKIAAERPNLWLLMAGPDEEGLVGTIVATVGEARRRMAIEGFTDTPEKLLAAADFVILPSYREGFGMVLIEAAAVGLPAIGSRIYGITDAIVDGTTGLLVPPGNVPELARAIGILADDRERRCRMGTAARARVLVEFEEALVVERYVQFLRKVTRTAP